MWNDIDCWLQNEKRVVQSCRHDNEKPRMWCVRWCHCEFAFRCSEFPLLSRIQNLVIWEFENALKKWRHQPLNFRVQFRGLWAIWDLGALESWTWGKWFMSFATIMWHCTMTAAHNKNTRNRNDRTTGWCCCDSRQPPTPAAVQSLQRIYHFQ